MTIGSFLEKIQHDNDYQGQIRGGTDVIGASSPGSTFYFAEGTTRPGFDTYFAIQNAGSDTANVQISYYKGDGTTQDQTLDVPPKTRSTVRVNDVIGEGDDAAHDFSAKVESTNGAPILVERPSYFSYQGPGLAAAATKGKLAAKVRAGIQDTLLGLGVGVLNGYLIAGTVGFFLKYEGYPFPALFLMPPDGWGSIVLAQKYLPPMLLAPWLPYLLIAYFLFVIVAVI